jgi:integrase
MYPALVVDLNCGLRDKELRELRWRQIDLVHKKQLTVGKSKTDAGTGRVIPLNDTGHDRPRGARRVVHPAVR